MIEFHSEDYHVQVLAPDVIGPDGTTSLTNEILTQDALRLVGLLCSKYENRRQALLQARKQRAVEIDSGILPHFSSDPNVADPSWKCAPLPDDLQDRRVEITGPVDRKMVINGLNSGASVYMADFEDSTSPTWSNLIEGQANLKDAVNGTITFQQDASSKLYQLNPNSKTAILFVRPRGWHLDEAHVLVNGKVASGAIFDFALYLFHNHAQLVRNNTRPYYYLPKLESRYEARLWNDVILTAQQYLGLPIGTVRATVLLETITASFEMEEILFELRDHSIGLNCGRWDYLFSFIKKFKYHPDKLTPDRSHLTMTTPLMQAYVQRLIAVCHNRGTFAMGGMSAAIPIKNDPTKNQLAMQQVEQDKIREVQAGHDGTWVAHPALVQVAKRVFDQYMPSPNQINKVVPRKDIVTEQQLVQLPTNIPVEESITSARLYRGIAIVLAYTEAWLRGVGCIPLHNAMEDAATAEISRAQIWSWRIHNVITQDDQQVISAERISNFIQQHVQEQLNQTKDHANNKWRLAGTLVDTMLNKDELDDFLTSVCYPYIVTNYQVDGIEGPSSKL